MVVLTRAQVRNLDRIAVERYGIPGIVLMENAGRGAAEALLRRELLTGRPSIGIVAGRGNNGGDGFVIARHLRNRGHRVGLVVLGPPESFRGEGEAGTNFGIVERLGIPVAAAEDARTLRESLSGFDLLVDAVLGTGLEGPVRGLPALAIEALNAAGVPVYALDIPSGLDCDTGRPLGCAVRAAATATFAARKAGFEAPDSRAFTGPVDVVDIGCPVEWE